MHGIHNLFIGNAKYLINVGYPVTGLAGIQCGFQQEGNCFQKNFFSVVTSGRQNCPGSQLPSAQHLPVLGVLLEDSHVDAHYSPMKLYVLTSFPEQTIKQTPCFSPDKTIKCCFLS